MSVNKVILVGNLGKDAEEKNLKDGLKVLSFSVATSERYKDKDGNVQEQTEWHNCTWFTKANISKFLKKGSKVYIEGKIKTEKYEDKYYTKIHISNLQMLDKKPSGSNEKASSSNSDDDYSDDLPF